MLRVTANSHGSWTLGARLIVPLLALAQSVPLMDDHGGTFGSLPRVTSFMPTAALQAWTVLRRARLLPCLVRPQLCLARL
jgi:hypothetical protein